MFNWLRRDDPNISSCGPQRGAHLAAVMINNAGRSIKLWRFYNAFKHTRATSEGLTTSTPAFRRRHPDSDAARSRAGNADLSVQNGSGGKKPRTKIVMERPRYRAETGNQSFFPARPSTQNNARFFAAAGPRPAENVRWKLVFRSYATLSPIIFIPFNETSHFAWQGLLPRSLAIELQRNIQAVPF